MPAWEALVREQGPLILRVAWRILRNVQDAEDVAQEVLLELFRRSAADPPDPGFLRCLAVRRAIDRLRARRPTLPLDAAQLPQRGPGPDGEILHRELLERLRSSVAQLPPRQAEVFCLRHLEQLSYDDIARHLAISREAVAVSLHEGRLRLRGLLGITLEGTCP
jgi:RNA polymerase sigma-70 factor (ECF subfamily)